MLTRGALCFLLSLALAAQTPGPGVIRVTTRLVEISVIVRDKNGPVKGLTKGDFAIFDKSKEQQVAFFSVSASVLRVKPAQLAAALGVPIFTNRIDLRTETPTAATVILLDGINTDNRDQVYAREQFLKYLSQIRPDDRIAVYTLGAQLRVLNDFTSDAHRLVAALARYKGETLGMLDASTPDVEDTGDATLDAILTESDGVIADFNIENRVRNTTAAMEAIANHLARVPGRKNLIWISGSFPFAIGLDSPDNNPSDQISQVGSSSGVAGAYGVNNRDGSPARDNKFFKEEVDRATAALNNANIAVYPVDARGLVVVPKSMTAEGAKPRSRGRAYGPQTVQSLIPTGSSAIHVMAENTGGRAFENTNDIRGAINSAVEDSEVTYTLGFYPDQKPDSKFHPVKVVVKGKSLDVRYRKGYLAIPDAAPSVHERVQEIRDAIWSPLEATGISLTASVAKVDQPKAGSLEFTVAVAPEDIGLVQKDGRWTGVLDIVFAQRGVDGRDLGTTTKSVGISFDQPHYQTLLKEGFTITKTVEPAADVAQVRVILYDRTSAKLGSLLVPIRP
jgi:VWFA-related protein